MNRSGFHGPRKQRGAALYVALIFLVIMALLGVTGMQIAAMQERMSSSYQATNAAFQRAEAAARQAEAAIRSDPASVHPDDECGNYDPVGFGAQAAIASERSDAKDPLPRIVNIDACVPANDIGVYGGAPASEKVFSNFRVTVYRGDRAGQPNSDAVVDTIFILP
ncbi:PilX N-terminal domain-containing pilus assembly protein [Lysobacter sp. 5GHs7-4]|uniref:pilus assembly PilX family protein n=1 Tax=Lysobacter sp. 5GHs7-4 TaxID=2904253 RepID=UPI001E62E35F|nr:PilX N-terminal domain-containing pilus assembly protein [Lysobacter sp. 5GHs7-4]UHQ22183.1 PilX N-terminal domain-containing pilus assembly protein [Lysobacter sp. 5GHs7-4]